MEFEKYEEPSWSGMSPIPCARNIRRIGFALRWRNMISSRFQTRILRGRLRLSPEEFAAALGFGCEHARITVWRWETGRRKPSSQTIMLMKELASRTL